MSVGVSYLNSRKVIKVTPTQKLQAVLEEACDHFKLDASCCRLKKGKAVVDMSLPYRFSNLPNNTTLDLEVFTQKQVGASSKLASSRIALGVNGKSLSATFPVTHCLTDIISHFIKEGTCPDILEDVAQTCPEIIYLQSRFGVESFETTTLSGLGLAGSSARLQLRFKEGQKVEKIAGSVSSESEGKGSTEVPTTVFAKSESEAASEMIKDDAALLSQEALSADIPSPMSALKSMLEKNFDAVNKPAVIVLCKYLFNIFAHPDVEKYRTLFTDNKAFREKVACAQGSMEFLASAGFVSSQASGRPSLALPSFSGGATAQALRFESSCRALEQALVELQVPSEERIVLMTPKALKEAAGVAVGGAPAQEFNPYKTFVRRVADGSNGASVMPPEGSADRKSATQERLEQLQKRRRELEGDLDCVARDTRLYLPGAEYAPAKQDTGMKMDVDDDDDDGNDGKPDSRLLAQSLRGKLSKDDAPLTTAASRAVLKAQSETVYSKTAIKVRFPDKSTLTGMFHPRHRVQDIYNWVLDCLNAELVEAWRGASGAGAGKKRSGQSLQADYPFELYTAPPRTVLTVNVAQSGVYNRWDGEEDDVDDRESLSGRKLVPAAQIMVSWSSPVVEAWMKNIASEGGAKAAVAAAAGGGGGYFGAGLLEGAVAVDKAAAPALSAALFPSGRALVEPSAANPVTSSSSMSSSSPPAAGPAHAGAEADSKSSGAKKGKKPSWFKL